MSWLWYPGFRAPSAPQQGLASSVISVRRCRQSSVQPLAAAPDQVIGSLIGSNMRIGIVVARFNELVTRLLLAGTLESLTRHGVAEEDVQVSS